MSEATSEKVVLSQLEDGVLVVKFNRPERLNATTPEMMTQYMQTMLAASDDRNVRVIVVTGAGKGFCAGADSAVLGERAKGAPRVKRLRPHWFVTQIPKPVIAAINGPCVGVGFAMAMMCDMRFAAQSARIGPGFARLGLAAEHGAAWMLAHVTGYARAFEALTRSQLFQGEELKRLGFVNDVLPDDQLMAHTMNIARDLATNCSPRSLAIMKRQLQHAFHEDLPAADERADRLTGMCFEADDFQEAIRGRKEKRPPQFKPLDTDPGTWWPEDEPEAA